MKKRVRMFVFFVCLVFLGSTIAITSNQLHAQHIDDKTSIYCSNNEGAEFGKCFLDIYFDEDEDGLPTNTYDDLQAAIANVQANEMPVQNDVQIYTTFHSEKRADEDGNVLLNASDMKAYATYTYLMSDMLKDYGKLPLLRDEEKNCDLSRYEVVNNELTPDMFQGGSAYFQGIENIIMPKNLTTIKDMTFQPWDGEITFVFPASLTTIEEQAFPASSYQNLHVTFLGDTSSYIEKVVNKKFKTLKIDPEVNDALLTTSLFANANMDTLDMSGVLNIPNKTLDLNQLYGASNPSLSSLIINDGYANIQASGFTHLKKVRIQGNLVSSLDLHDNAIDDVSEIRTDYGSTDIDVSGNAIDFTNPDNVAFLSAYTGNAKVELGQQKPILYAQNENTNLTITALADLDIPVPTFRYADHTAVDFTQAAPSWMDVTYYNEYASNIAIQLYDEYIRPIHKEDITSNGTYYYDFLYNDTTSITHQGRKKITLQLAEEVGKETPTIALNASPNTNVHSNQDITLSATLSSTQSRDINDSASVTFYDGATVLGSVHMGSGKAELVKQFTSGTHTLTATYSGNANFETVTSTPLSLMVSEPSSSGKQPQTLTFAKSEEHCIYGDAPSANLATLTQPHSTNPIVYQSTNPEVATINASTGEVTALKAGVTQIQASVAADDAYDAAQASYTLTIDKRVLTLNNLKVKDKVYDGKKDAQFDTTALTVGNILQVDADKISLIQGNVSFKSIDAGIQKETIIEDMMIHGDVSVTANYTLTIPTLYGTITKKDASIQVNNLTKQQGEANPPLTYTLTGLVSSDKESTLSDYSKPTLTTPATQSSAVGDYAIQASSASARNYTFTYQPGVLHVKAADEALTTADYKINGTKGKNDWYVSTVTITPTNGYTKIWDKTSWKNQILLNQGIHKDIEFKLQKADGTQTKAGTLPTLQIDTTPPLTDNIKDGTTYLLNRTFYAIDDNVNKVTVNGTTITDYKNGVLLDGDQDKAYEIEVEDKAGNLTSLRIQMKPLADILSLLDTINNETVKIEDQAEIESLLKQVQALITDDSYTPSEAQKAKLKEVETTCTTLLDTISKQAGVNQETPNGDVLTGDTTSLLMLCFIVFSSIYAIVLVHRRRTIEKDN